MFFKRLENLSSNLHRSNALSHCSSVHITSNVHNGGASSPQNVCLALTTTVKMPLQTAVGIRHMIASRVTFRLLSGRFARRNSTRSQSCLQRTAVEFVARDADQPSAP